ncbi:MULTISPECIES: metallophosphoesterase [unclassified Massilia]|uniref:metallophosphoesterase n=1 Tax=unclassified Massilia TaxID=2609279 RepID=UPI001E30EB2E|nr:MULTISPECIES: metallophosphoesterase [unclassified Massilia]
MRLLILSDLHLEVWRELAPHIDISISRPDVIILAGDIHTKARAPAWAAKTFPGVPVLYIAGNHEFYGELLKRSGLHSTRNARFIRTSTTSIAENMYCRDSAFWAQRYGPTLHFSE